LSKFKKTINFDGLFLIVYFMGLWLFGFLRIPQL